MGLHSEVTTDLAAAFYGELADAVVELNLIKTTQTYDEVTGGVVDSATTTVSRGTVEPVADSMVDGEVIQVQDKQFLILADELAATPELADEITLVSGVSYSINNIAIDPAGVAWIIIGRLV